MEIYDILMADDVVESINDNRELLLSKIPELAAMFNFEHHHPYHYLNVWNHTLLALKSSQKDFEVRLALLLHDIGKPFCYQVDNGIRHYKGHNEISYRISKRIFKRLNLNDKTQYNILELILKHDTPITKNDIINNYELSLKRYEIQRCDILAHDSLVHKKREQYLEETKKLIYQYKN